MEMGSVAGEDDRTDRAPISSETQIQWQTETMVLRQDEWVTNC